MNKLKIVEFLYNSQGSEYNVNQIAKKTHISVGSAFKILKLLEAEKTVSTRGKKNAIMYSINANKRTREMYFQLVSKHSTSNWKKTKIIGTIGPACKDPKILRKLIDQGLSCIRINASHCTEQSAKELIDIIRSVDKSLPILIDIPGPKVRLNNLTRPLKVYPGDTISFTFQKGKDNELLLDLPLYKYVKVGQKILVDDGKIEFKVKKSDKKELVCQAVNEGTLKEKKGVNFPDSFVEYQGISKKDEFWIAFAKKHDIDYIGTSFVRNPNDVLALNKLLGYKDLGSILGAKTKVIAKIETKEAIKNYKEIIKQAYGIMIDRGDLGSETRIEIIPRFQKMIIDECNHQGKPVIIATQMLDAMVENNQPTKAEVSDIATAVVDGASTLMLSAETAAGTYPIEAVQTMSAVIKEMERDRKPFAIDTEKTLTFTDCIVSAIEKIDSLMHIDAVVIVTSGGYAARMLASRGLRPKVVAITSSEKVARQMKLLWGVMPLHVPKLEQDNVDDDAKEIAIREATSAGFLKGKDRIIMTGSNFKNKTKRTNFLEIHTVGEFLES